MDEFARLLMPSREEFQPARLVTDEQRVRDWFDRLSDVKRLRSYSLAEIRAAVSIPATRLRIVLYRLGWKPHRELGFGVLTYYKPNGSLWPNDVADADFIAAKLRESS